MKPRRIIINADDFGLSSAVNEAVLAAAERGVLSSATVMVNMPGFEEAVRGALASPSLGVGVHLNLLRGRPVSDPSRIPSLVGKGGGFLGAKGLAMRILLGMVDPEHAEAELSAQIGRAIESGIKPSHVDSEKHMHLAFPLIGLAACRAAEGAGIRCIRVAREAGGPAGAGASLSQRLKSAFISRRSRRFAKTAEGHGLRFTDSFLGIALTGRMTADVMCSVFKDLPEGTTELMTHPAAKAGAAQIAGQRSWLDRQRVAEYRALLDASVKDALDGSGASLITYRDI